MKDLRCIVTGGNAGIGLATARGLARLGARVGIVCRNAGRAERTAASLRDETGAPIDIFVGDLSLVRDNRRVGEDILRSFGSLDVLVNNVGAVFPEFGRTREGFEHTLALNHLGPFTLTHTLAPALVEGTGRVVNVSSQVHAHELDLDELNGDPDRHAGLEAYRRSKLCNLLFTRSLAARLAPRGITSNALHPGVVQTGLLADYDRARDAEQAERSRARSPLRRLASAAARTLRGGAPSSTGISPDDGARTSLHLATSPDVADVSGAYFVDCAQRAPAPIAVDDALAERLWAQSEAWASPHLAEPLSWPRPEAR